MSMWDRMKVGGKSGFDKVWKAADKLGAPVNRLSNKLGSEAFWPTTLDKESDKAARILKTFCKDGFYAEEEYQTAEGPKQKQKVVKKIPTSVIQNAKGLAIFTTMRTGLWWIGDIDSPARRRFVVTSLWYPTSYGRLGFLVGVDIYDCVVVINTEEALEAFTKVRCTLGSEISIAAGPVGAGGVLESEVHKRQAPIFTYLKSRGFYAGVQIDGTVIIERTDENERFYGQRIPVREILAGKVRHPPYEIKRLLETIKAAQGDTDVDQSMLPTEAAPSDFDLEAGHVFGVPDKEDPDPYGVLALEKEGLSIKEAGTQKRASWEAFYFAPAVSSPIHKVYDRNSSDKRRSGITRKSWRTTSSNSIEVIPENGARHSTESSSQTPTTIVMDESTQTEDERPSIGREHSRSSSKTLELMQEVPEDSVLETSASTTEVNGYSTPPQTPPFMAKMHEPVEDDIDDDDVHIEEPVVQSVKIYQPKPAQVVSKARLVTVPKREVPALPPRNPSRTNVSIESGSPKEGSLEDVSVESKHDSAHEVQNEKDVDVESVRKDVEDVKLNEGADEDHATTRPEASHEEVKHSVTPTQDVPSNSE